MGDKQSKVANRERSNVEDIYSMFKQGSSVMIRALEPNNADLSHPKIKNIQSAVQQLLEPFKQTQRYIWGAQIYINFQKHFLENFQMLWLASRQNFYQSLLINCKLSAQHLEALHKNYASFQNAFYKIAGEQLDIGGEMSFLENRVEHFLKNVHALTILGEQLQHQATEKPTSELRTKKRDSNQKAQNNKLYNPRRLIIKASSKIIPQNSLITRLSLEQICQINDLSKFYKQFSNSLQEAFFSNNLVSCPMKNFLMCFEARVDRKKIKMAKQKELQKTNSIEENRKMYKKREANNNFLLAQAKSFINAYTKFLWMFFQLHQMEALNLSKIINFQVIYGIIFKHVWTFIDWIVDRGYQLQENELQSVQSCQLSRQARQITPDMLERYIFLIDNLRNQRHPQEYLKKVTIFYREVSKNCRNADEMLAVYEEVLVSSIKRKGSRSLALLRMRNIIEKLLIVSGSQLLGGQIGYSWTNWRIVIEILKENASSQKNDTVQSWKNKSKLATSGTKTNTVQLRIVQQKATKFY